uniref:Short myomegalin-like EB1 binding protein N-terminal domain-containing protein n=1 Tax=Oncorhynchus tshawytscha TaxID=74940 RepID=A0A8C8FL44_ONCTS
MKEACRICARELCGNQRRWIFHPASKLNLQVLLSHALGRELIRDGRGEFACSKCAFILERMYRFDTVIARVEALSIERLQRLLQEKHRLRGLIGGLYRKTNREDGGGCAGAGEGMVDMSGLTHAKYCALLQEDLVYSLYESWAEEGLEFGEVTAVGSQRCGTVTRSPRKCRGCTAWRVADSDYEAVCKVPRKLARSISCDPSTRYSVSVIGGGRASGGGRGGEKDPDGTPSSLTLIPGSNPTPRASDSDPTLVGRASSSPSIDSLDITGESTQLSAIQDGPEGLEYPQDPLDDRFSDSLSEEHHLVTPLRSASRLSLALCLVQNCVYRPVQSPKGSRLPVLNRQGPSSRGSRLTNNAVRLQRDITHLYIKRIPYTQTHTHTHTFLSLCFSLSLYTYSSSLSLSLSLFPSSLPLQKLQEKLIEMECELRSIRQGAQSQERTIQCLTDSVSTKDNEAVELYQLIEGQNATLCKLREMAHQGGSEGASLAQFQGELVGLQSSLFTLGLELEASQRAQKQSQRQAEDLSRAKDRLHSDLKEALQHREVTDKHNQVCVLCVWMCWCGPL